MAMLAESRLPFRQDLTVQPFAMVSGYRWIVTKMCRKKAKLVATPLESFGSLRLKRSLPSSVSSRFRPSPAKKAKSAGHTLAAKAGQCSTTCITVSAPHNRHKVSSSVRNVECMPGILSARLFHTTEFIGMISTVYSCTCCIE